MSRFASISHSPGMRESLATSHPAHQLPTPQPPGPVTCDREKGEQQPCSEYSVRIGLMVHPDGRWVALSSSEARPEIERGYLHANALHSSKWDSVWLESTHAAAGTDCTLFQVLTGRFCWHVAVHRHEFDRLWEVEKMPGPRCIFDGVLLRNGHVVLIGGQQVRAARGRSDIDQTLA